MVMDNSIDILAASSTCADRLGWTMQALIEVDGGHPRLESTAGQFPGFGLERGISMALNHDSLPESGGMPKHLVRPLWSVTIAALVAAIQALLIL